MLRTHRYDISPCRACFTTPHPDAPNRKPQVASPLPRLWQRDAQKSLVCSCYLSLANLISKPFGRKIIAMGSERSEDPRKNVPIMPISPIGRQDMSVQLNSVAQRGCLKVTVQTRGSASLHRHRYDLSPFGLCRRHLITGRDDEGSRG